MLHKLRSGKAREATGWLIDCAGTMDEALQMTWKIATDGDAVLSRRKLAEDRLKDLPSELSGITESDNPATTAARKAIFACIQKSCNATLSEALTIQAKHSAEFMTSSHCKNGSIGIEFKKTMLV